MNTTNKSSLFGYETRFEESALVLLPVPWEVSVSYGAGSSKGPRAILEASPQLDLFTYDPSHSFRENPIYWAEENTALIEENNLNKQKAQKIIKHLEADHTSSLDLSELTDEVNFACENMVDWVYQTSQQTLALGKKVAVIGGDHSCPLGLVKALSEQYKNYDILHIDAHLDLRKAYQGFKHSHASIMYNILQLKNSPQNLISVGIRDYCAEEMNLVHDQQGLESFTDAALAKKKFHGQTWSHICDEILAKLENPTYISFDIDGLDPVLCPNTGTPVPGGLNFQEAQFLLEKMAKHKKVIGFDLCEVSPSPDPTNEWDGNVGARILFLLYKCMFSS